MFISSVSEVTVDAVTWCGEGRSDSQYKKECESNHFGDDTLIFLFIILSKQMTKISSFFPAIKDQYYT